MGDPQLLTTDTDTATYHQHAGSHVQESTIAEEHITAADAIVLESGAQQYKDVSLDDLLHNQQYGRLLRTNLLQDDPVPVFLVDLPYRRSDSAVFASTVGKLAVPAMAGVLGAAHVHPAAIALALPAAAFSAGSTDNILPKRLAAYAQLSNAYNSLGYRSAVAAEKLDRFVAPHLATDRPDILIDYGAGHLDISTYLQHPRLRQAVITANDTTGGNGTDGRYRTRACEFSFDGQSGEQVNIGGEQITCRKRIHSNIF